MDPLTSQDRGSTNAPDAAAAAVWPAAAWPRLPGSGAATMAACVEQTQSNTSAVHQTSDKIAVVVSGAYKYMHVYTCIYI